MKYLFLLLFSILSIHAFAQDLIVSIGNDSLKCKIIQIDSTNISYTYSFYGNTSKGIIKRDMVAAYYYNYYIVAKPIIKKNTYTKPSIQFGFGIGKARFLAPTAAGVPSSYDKVIEELRKARLVEFGFTFFSKKNGIHFGYSKTSSKGSESVLVNTWWGNYFTTIFSTIELSQLDIQYVRPYNLYKNKLLLNYRIGISYANYINKVNSDKLTAHGLGICTDANLIFHFTNYTSIYGNVGVDNAVFNNAKINNKPEKLDGAESTLRTSISVGFLFNFNTQKK